MTDTKQDDTKQDDTKQDRHVYVMSSDHGNSDCGGTGDIGSD